MKNKKIAFIGAGNIAQSMIIGLIKKGYPSKLIYVSAPSNKNINKLTNLYDINSNNNNITQSNIADIIILAVKPQVIKKICEEISNIDLSKKLIISIAAGIKLNFLNQILGQNIQILRIMLNIACEIGKSTIGIYSNSNINIDNKKFISLLMTKLGKIFWLKKEKDINLFTIISGSAPVYFFLLINIIYKKIYNMGIDKNLAYDLIVETSISSSKIADLYRKKISLSELIMNITSYKGTTASLLNVLEKYKFEKIISKSIDAGINRIKEIEKLH